MEISGLDLDDCVSLGHRHEIGRSPAPAEMESWLMWATLDEKGEAILQFPFGVVGWFSGLWLSPGRTLYVSDLEGQLYANPLATCRTKPWVPVQKFPSGTQLHGLWGIDDEHVFVWATDRDGPFLLQGTGATWARRPSPEFEVILVRGSRPERLVAVGNEGEVARWDGTRWSAVPLPAGAGRVTGLHVVGDEHFWLCTHAGQLLEGSPEGVVRRAGSPGPSPLSDVAVWKGEVWLAAGEAGLMRWVRGTQVLELVKPKINVTSFDARGHLLMNCPGKLAVTEDGVSYRSVLRCAFAKSRGAVAPHWED